VSRLPRDIRQSGLLDDIGNWHFNRDDIEAVHQAILLRDIARWVAKAPADPLLSDWLDHNEAIDDLQREQLGIAERLFDWTVRNLQLVKTTPYPEEKAEATVGEQSPSADTRPAPQRGLSGPGYEYTPREALLYGYCDAQQRAWVFMALAQQQGIDTVYLAFPGQSIPPRPRPWVVGVLLEQELFLFDSELGLPIPGPEGKGIATLSQVLDQPELLDELDVGDLKYPVTAEDLKEVIALICAPPASLSERMQIVEKNLAGDERTILSTSPTRLGERVTACRGISFATIWAVPYEAIWFRRARDRILQTNRDAAMQYYAAVGVFQNQGPLVRGRYLQLKGEFEGHDKNDNAKALYLQCRIPDALLDELETSKQIQKTLGIVRGPQDGDFVWQARLANAKRMALQSKLHSTYWIGLCHYETGNYPAALSFIAQRTLEATPDGPWTEAARYNLSRTYEALGQLEKAREILLEDIDSPQVHGDRLRAKILRKRIEQATATKKQSEEQPAG